VTKIVPQPGIMDIAPYEGGASHVEGRANALKLSSNENPLGPPEAAREAFARAVHDLHRYPSSDHAALRHAIGEVWGLDPTRIVCGVGSDEIIHMLCQAYAGPKDQVIHTAHGFAMYRISALAAGAIPVEVPERDRITDVDMILAACNRRTKLVFIANPNNPTGTMIGLSEVARLADRLPAQALLVLDGAYAEYVDGYDGGAGLIEARENVVMTRTFSKIYGLGGLRVGWGYGPQRVMDVLNRVRGPFNLSYGRLCAAEAAVRDRAWVARCRVRERALARVAGARRSRRWACLRTWPRELHPGTLRGRPRRPTPATRTCAPRGSSCGAWRATSCPTACASPWATRRPAAAWPTPSASSRGGAGRRGGVLIYERVALIGLGLIASSMAHAMRRGGLAGEVVGHARSAETRATAREMGLVDRVEDTAEAAVRGADLVVLCVPVGAMAEVAEAIAPALRPGATVSDVGSVKRAVIAAVAPRLPPGVTSCPPTPSPAPSSRGRARASPRSSTTAGACSCRATPTARPWSALGASGAGSGPTWTRWTRTTTTRSSPWCPTPPTSSPTPWWASPRTSRRCRTRRSSSSRPRGSGTSRASQPRTPSCGATCS
jgi:histidinol-phosphate aminotransferase